MERWHCNKCFSRRLLPGRHGNKLLIRLWSKSVELHHHHLPRNNQIPSTPMIYFITPSTRWHSPQTINNQLHYKYRRSKVDFPWKFNMLLSYFVLSMQWSGTMIVVSYPFIILAVLTWFRRQRHQAKMYCKAVKYFPPLFITSTNPQFMSSCHLFTHRLVIFEFSSLTLCQAVDVIPLLVSACDSPQPFCIGVLHPLLQCIFWCVCVWHDNGSVIVCWH